MGVLQALRALVGPPKDESNFAPLSGDLDELPEDEKVEEPVEFDEDDHES